MIAGVPLTTWLLLVAATVSGPLLAVLFWLRHRQDR
jgi:hypothetical protein